MSNKVSKAAEKTSVFRRILAYINKMVKILIRKLGIKKEISYEDYYPKLSEEVMLAVSKNPIVPREILELCQGKNN